VLDAAGSDRATLFGNARAGLPAIAAAVAHPERVDGLILCGTFAKGSWSENYPLGWTDERDDEVRDYVKTRWGKAEGIWTGFPSLAG
jgi:pimeloyl-ACP methyl ester carboxylesterase